MAQTMMVNVLPTAPAAAPADAPVGGNAAPPEAGATPFPQMLQRQIAAPQPEGKETGSKSYGAAADKDAVPADTGTGHGGTSPLTAALAAWLGVVLPGSAAAGQTAAPGNNVAAALSAVADAGVVSAGVQTAAGGLGGSGQDAAPPTPGQVMTAPRSGVTLAAATALAAMPTGDASAASAAAAGKLPGGPVSGNSNGAAATAGNAAAGMPTAVSALLSPDIPVTAPPAGASPVALAPSQPPPATAKNAGVAAAQAPDVMAPLAAAAGSSPAASPLYAAPLAAAATDVAGAPARTAGNATNATAAPAGAFLPGGTASPGVLIAAAGAATAAQQGAMHDGASPRHDDTAQQTAAAAALPTPTPTPAAEVAVPASGPAAASPEQQSIIRQIVDQAFLAVQQDKQEMHIKLKPEQLGTVTLHIAVDDGRVNARFYVDNAAVQQVLESSLGQLRQQLAGQGFNVQQLAVFNGFGRDWPQPGHRQPGPHRATRRAPVAAVTDMDGAAMPRDVWRQSTSGIDYRV